MKFLRLIGVVVLAEIFNLFISEATFYCFAGVAYLFNGDFTFVKFLLFCGMTSILPVILLAIYQGLTMGVVYLTKGSKLIAIIALLLFINNFANDCMYLLGDKICLGEMHDSTLGMIKMTFSETGYKIGAGVTLFVEFLCYLIISCGQFVVVDE